MCLDFGISYLIYPKYFQLKVRWCKNCVLLCFPLDGGFHCYKEMLCDVKIYLHLQLFAMWQDNTAADVTSSKMYRQQIIELSSKPVAKISAK